MICLLAFASFTTASAQGQTAASAQDKARSDSAVNALKVKNLRAQITALDKQIKQEDAKRNKTVLGVSPEQLEIMNDRQDSVCLALRSQRTDKELELKEITAKQTAAVIAQQLSVLQQQGTDNNASQPGKPTKPTKPTKPNKPSKPTKPGKPSASGRPSKNNK